MMMMMMMMIVMPGFTNQSGYAQIISKCADLAEKLN
jgi:pentose-5-phosphate-3-epimerase